MTSTTINVLVAIGGISIGYYFGFFHGAWVIQQERIADLEKRIGNRSVNIEKL